MLEITIKITSAATISITAAIAIAAAATARCLAFVLTSAFARRGEIALIVLHWAALCLRRSSKSYRKNKGSKERSNEI